MKDKIGVVAINEFIGWKSKMYLFLADHNSGHKKAKGLNTDVVVTIRHNEYKVILLNKKCLTHLLNRIQSKDHRIGTYKTNKTSSSCFDDKIYIQNNRHDD